MKKRKKTKKWFCFKHWLPVIVWMGVIFYFSSESSLSVGVGGADEYLIRKFAHITEFGILAVLMLILLSRGCGILHVKIFLSAFVLTIFYALSDEFHQTFIVGRNGNIEDVLVDSLGALLFLQLIAFSFFTKRRKYLLISILLNLLAIFFLLTNMMEIALRELDQQNQINDIPKIQLIEEIKGDDDIKEGDEEECDCSLKVDENITIPTKLLLEVPFSSQAPFANWDNLHEEACEEMSLIMVKFYFDKKKLSPKIAENEIQKLKDYQLLKNGHYMDSDMNELSKIADEYYKMKNFRIIENVTKDKILENLTKGGPVIVPTAGRVLGNPNFSGLGPLYHNLVIVGFDESGFITNDPGTRNGKYYHYDFKILMNAIHDFPGNKKGIIKGEKRAIFFTKDT